MGVNKCMSIYAPATFIATLSILCESRFAEDCVSGIMLVVLRFELAASDAGALRLPWPSCG